MKDTNNGFPYVGKLNDMKYKKLLKLQKNLYKISRISQETRGIIDAGIAPSYDPLLSKLNLD